MQLETAKLPGSQLDLTFKLDAQDVKRAFDKVYSELAQQGSVPGFRPGKAPASIIKRRYKPELLRDMFWMKAVETFVEPELEKEELQVIGDPEFPKFDEIELAEDQGVEFNIKVTVRPEPVLPEYAGMKLYRIEPAVTDEQVAEVIEQMRNTAAKEVAVEGRDTVEDGDLVQAEVSITLEGAEEPLHTSTQPFEIGSGRYQPALDQEMLGHKVGETIEVQHEYPEDLQDETLAGKKGTIRATIQELKQRILPELDDEFAKSQGEYEGLDDLRAKMREQMENDAARHSKQTLENDALSAVVKDTEVDLPLTLVDQIARRGYQSFIQDLQQEGLSLEDFKEIAKVDEETLQRNEHVRAQIALKVDLVLDAVGTAENIEVADSDIDDEIREFAVENKLEEDFLRNALDLQEGFREQLEDRARRRLIVQALINKADIEDVSSERYEEIRQQERQEAEAKAEAEVAEAAVAEVAAAAADVETASGEDEAAAETPAEEEASE